MPKQYEAIRDKFVSKGMPLAEAKTHAAKIYNSTHHDAPVTGKAEPAMNKGYQGSTTKYAEGGPVQAPQASRFMKTEDQFRAAYHSNPNAGKDKPYGKSGPNAGKGEDPPPAAKSKSAVSIPKK